MGEPGHGDRALAPRSQAAHAVAGALTLGIVGFFVLLGLGPSAAAVAVVLALVARGIGADLRSGAVLAWCAPLAVLAIAGGADAVPRRSDEVFFLACCVPIVLPVAGLVLSAAEWRVARAGGPCRLGWRAAGALMAACTLAVTAAAIASCRHPTLGQRLARSGPRGASETMARLYDDIRTSDSPEAAIADPVEVEVDPLTFVAPAWRYREADWSEVLAFDGRGETVLVPTRVLRDPIAPPRMSLGLAAAGLLFAGIAFFGADRMRARRERLEHAEPGVVRDDGLVELDRGTVVRTRIEHEPGTRVAVERAPERSAYRVSAVTEARASFRLEAEREEAIEAARWREHALLGWCAVAVVLTIGPLVCAWLTGHAVL